VENIAKNINVTLSLKDRFSGQIKKASESTERFSKKLSRSSKDVSRFERVLNNTAKRAAKAMPKLAAATVAGITGSVAAVLDSTKELRNDLARLDTNARNAGIGLNVTKKAMQELSKFSDETDSNVEAISNLLASGLNEKQLLKTLDALSGAAIKFSDTLKIEGLADGFEETLATGMGVGPFGELVERLGYNLDDFNAGLQKAKKNGTELEYVLRFLDKTGLAQVKQTFEETNPDLVAANQQAYIMQQRMAKLGTVLQPVANRLLGITKAGQIRENSLLDLAGRGIDNLTNKLQEWEQNGTLDTIGTRVDKVFSAGAKAAGFFAENIGVIGPLLAGLATALTAINFITKLAFAFRVANPPIMAITLALTAVSTALMLLYTNWDKITGAIKSGVDTIQSKLNGFAEKLASIGSGFGNFLNNINPFKKDTIPQHATGTSYFAGGLTRVNEGGRGEIVNLPNGTQIIPHDVSKKQMGKGINLVVNLIVQGNMIGNAQYADYIGGIIAKRVKHALTNI